MYVFWQIEADKVFLISKFSGFWEQQGSGDSEISG